MQDRNTFLRDVHRIESALPTVVNRLIVIKNDNGRIGDDGQFWDVTSVGAEATHEMLKPHSRLRRLSEFNKNITGARFNAQLILTCANLQFFRML